MEKRGDLLNQLAIISDLLEKVNIEAKSQTIFIELDVNEFNKAYDIISKKHGKPNIEPKTTFNIRIGNVDVFFNKSNV